MKQLRKKVCITYVVSIIVLLYTGSEIQADEHCLSFKPGDALSISVFPDTSHFLNGVYTIDNRGYSELPIIGPVKVTDMSKRELEDSLKTVYISYLRYPHIQIKPMMRIALLGGFYNPGLYWIEPQKNVWNLVQLGGGTIREDGITKMHWDRNQEVVSSDLVPIFESGQSLCELGFQSGDQIQVTQRPKQRPWDVFRQDVLPVLATTITAISTSVTLYFAIKTFND